MESIKNFAINVRPVIVKLKNNEKLSDDERKMVVEFYMEVVNTVIDWEGIPEPTVIRTMVRS